MMNKEYMLRMKPKIRGAPSSTKSGGCEAAAGWEVRPGGMFVQKRTSDSSQSSNPAPNIRVGVKYGSSYHEFILSSVASFEIASRPNWITSADQKLIFKEKERDSSIFLDNAGVKDGSNVLLVEDEPSRERLESCRNEEMEKASKDIAAVRFEVDKLAKQVASIELEINGGNRVVDTVLLNLIELLMTQLIKLDGIAADGNVKLQRRMQVKRVQKYIETLDMLKIKNSGLESVPLQKQNKIFYRGKCY